MDIFDYFSSRYYQRNLSEELQPWVKLMVQNFKKRGLVGLTKSQQEQFEKYARKTDPEAYARGGNVLQQKIYAVKQAAKEQMGMPLRPGDWLSTAYEPMVEKHLFELGQWRGHRGAARAAGGRSPMKPKMGVSPEILRNLQTSGVIKRQPYPEKDETPWYRDFWRSTPGQMLGTVMSSPMGMLMSTFGGMMGEQATGMQGLTEGIKAGTMAKPIGMGPMSFPGPATQAFQFLSKPEVMMPSLLTNMGLSQYSDEGYGAGPEDWYRLMELMGFMW